MTGNLAILIALGVILIALVCVSVRLWDILTGRHRPAPEPTFNVTLYTGPIYSRHGREVGREGVGGLRPC